MTGGDTRLIEVAFPLEQVSLDSVHEKNVRHGHISTLHIWPARRPLAACRAALIATLLPDPGDAEERKEIYRRLAGEAVETVKTEKRDSRTVERRRRETKGGILHWGREGGADLDWFRTRIRETYGGRAPKVLDPFAGGGAIPLEAMRLGCEATAIDINPVAWFILKCTLDYPRRLAGATLPLPEFVRGDRDFMEAFLKARGFKGKTLARQLQKLGLADDGGEVELALIDHDPPPDADLFTADLAWQVRAWGRRVLARVRAALAHRYPTFAEFQALASGGRPFESRPLVQLEPDAGGKTDIGQLNERFDAVYLKDPRNPRWVTKPMVACLWARTVRCKSCRATVPLLKTRWLCKKDNKRVLLTMTPNADWTGVVFGVETGVPQARGNAAQRREDDKRLGAGTMSRSGARCPCCPAIMTMEDIRLEGRAGRLGATMTAVVVDGPKGKEYRLPEEEELRAAEVSPDELDTLYADIPFGLPTEPLPGKEALGFRIPLYGFDQWAKLFTDRQLLALGTILREIRRCSGDMSDIPDKWREALAAYLCCILSKLADYSSAVCSWHNSKELLRDTFARFALPVVWDYCEVNPLSGTSGGFSAMNDWVARYLDHAVSATASGIAPVIQARSAIDSRLDSVDLIATDPPYYDAIPYSDLMDFFHVWLRRGLRGVVPETDPVFADPLGPKWNADNSNGELIDDASRFDGDKALSKKTYEDGMARAFQACHEALNANGRLVVVFANKQPEAWETLVSALIRAGFVVDGSWPIQTEMQNRQRSLASAALASSVWLVCRKRPPAAPGWDAAVLAEMRANITRKLRDFWDAGIRGPDFVWAATGPALEAFSKHPVVKKADQPGALMTDGLGIPARGAPDGGGLRRGPCADRRRGRGGRERARRRDHLLLAAPERLRPGRGARRRLHPLCAVLQPFRRRPLRPLRGSLAPRPHAGRRGGRRSGCRRRLRRRQGEARALGAAQGQMARIRGAGRAAGTADRPRPPAYASLASRRGGPGERLHRRQRPGTPRPVRPASAGAHRTGARELGGTRAPRIAVQSPRRACRLCRLASSGARAGDAGVTTPRYFTLRRP